MLIDPGQDLGDIPVFSDLVSLQYIRPEGSDGQILFGNSDLAELEPADPDNYLNRATDDFIEMTIDKVGTRLPGLGEPLNSLHLRRMLRRHTRFQSRDLAYTD